MLIKHLLSKERSLWTCLITLSTVTASKHGWLQINLVDGYFN
jgi:hypothetical protein